VSKFEKEHICNKFCRWSGFGLKSFRAEEEHHQIYTTQRWLYMAMSGLPQLPYVSGSRSRCKAMLGNSILALRLPYHISLVLN
jgi:hypothetical protein